MTGFISMDTACAAPTEPTIADPLSRGVAKFIDILIAAALSRLLPPIGLYGAVTYLLIADALRPGSSLGKRLVGLSVRGPTGRECGVRESMRRNVVLAIPFGLWALLLQGGWIVSSAGWLILIAGFGLEAILLAGNPQGRRLGDDLAGTSVIGMTITDRT